MRRIWQSRMRPIINQAMRSQLQLLLFLGSLFVSGWPALLHAGQLEQTPHESSSSSFLLVASKQMPDPRFQKTVLLITRHGNTGPIGVILNRPEDITLDKMFPAYPATKQFSLFYGGPVYPKQVSYLVRGGETVKGALTISKDIYLAYDMPVLDELLSGKLSYKNLRVMHGLASWAPGQLEYEISQGGWYIMPFDEAVIFDRPPAEMWREMYNRATSITL